MAVGGGGGSGGGGCFMKMSVIPLASPAILKNKTLLCNNNNTCD